MPPSRSGFDSERKASCVELILILNENDILSPKTLGDIHYVVRNAEHDGISN